LKKKTKWFVHYLSLCIAISDCKEYFGKSLFIIGEFGANDYAFMKFGGKSLDLVHGYVPMVIKTISDATEVHIFSHYLVLNHSINIAT
jgi:hypothetical protein